jgi:hypothetical protein
MKIWPSIYPKNVYEEADVVVSCNNRRWYLYCLVVWDSFVLLLYGLSFERCDVGSINWDCLLCVVWGHGAVSNSIVLRIFVNSFLEGPPIFLYGALALSAPSILRLVKVAFILRYCVEK